LPWVARRTLFFHRLNGCPGGRWPQAVGELGITANSMFIRCSQRLGRIFLVDVKTGEIVKTESDKSAFTISKWALLVPADVSMYKAIFEFG
jgi:hypothetical protein